MCDVWTGQRNRPLRLLAVELDEQGEWVAREACGQTEKRPFLLMQASADPANGAELLYLTVEIGAYPKVAALAKWAQQQGALVLWNPGGLKNARVLPARGCVVLQSALRPEEEQSALHELFCTPGMTTTLDRKTLLQRLRAASRASLAMAQASGDGKNRRIAASLAVRIIRRLAIRRSGGLGRIHGVGIDRLAIIASASHSGIHGVGIHGGRVHRRGPIGVVSTVIGWIVLIPTVRTVRIHVRAGHVGIVGTGRRIGGVSIPSIQRIVGFT